MEDVLSDYKIKFYNKKIKNPVNGSERIVKIFTSDKAENAILSKFFFDYSNAIDIQQHILEPINDVTSGSIDESETGSQSGIAVFIKNDVTKFIDFNSNGSYLSPNLVVPTNIFKSITIAWMNFILQ